MGYTTNFEGRFNMSETASAEVIIKLRQLEGADGREMDDPDAPGTYCQWQITRDCSGIEWDGGEKFYDYVEWLQYIIDKILAPSGIHLTGSVAYFGEEVTDNGMLIIKDGKVEQVKTAQVAEEWSALVAFRDFVLKGRFGQEIAREWKRRNQ